MAKEAAPVFRVVVHGQVYQHTAGISAHCIILHGSNIVEL